MLKSGFITFTLIYFNHISLEYKSEKIVEGVQNLHQKISIKHKKRYVSYCFSKKDTYLFLKKYLFVLTISAYIDILYTNT